MNDTTICDNCGSEVALAEANTGDFCDWDGATLCNECYAELRFAHERDYRDSAPIRLVKDTVTSFPPRRATIVALDAAAKAMRKMPVRERVSWVLYLLESINDDSADYEAFLRRVVYAVATRVKRGRW